MARRRRNKTNAGKIDPNEIASSAIEYGISAIVRNHPRFRGFDLSEYIDQKRLTTQVREAYERLKRTGRLNSDGINYLHRKIADYVASGEAFDEVGRELVLKKGLEEKAKEKGILNIFSRRRAKEELEGIKSLDRKLGAYGRVHKAFEEGGGYGMSELRKPLEYLGRAGFLHAALEIEKEEGSISAAEYRRLSKNIAGGVKESHGEYLSKLEKYAQYSNEIAAAILGIFGIGIFLFSGAEITGNVVGGTTGNITGVFTGIILLAVSGILFLRSFKN